MRLGLEILLLVLVVVGTVLGTVFGILGSVAKKRVAAELARLQQEGVVLDSGPVSGRVAYRDYSAPGFYAGWSARATRRQLVLTRERLAILGMGSIHVPRSELHRYAASIDDGILLLATDAPIGASGHMELRLRVPDVEAWVRELRAAGATAAAAAA
jgi:hypothetical protein